MNSSRVLRRATALLLVGALAGCGSDNPVSSLDTDASAVSPPSNLRAQGALLQWDPSPDADVVGYEIEHDRLDRSVPEGSAFVAAGSRTNALVAYDVSVGETDWMDRWYRVRAIDSDGNRSVASNSIYVANGTTQDPTAPQPPPIERPVQD